MGSALLVYEEEIEGVYGGILQMAGSCFEEKGYKIRKICLRDGDSRRECVGKIEAIEDDYIFTLDMAGFQLDTLLNYPIYNIRRAKQIHLIIDEKAPAIYDKVMLALNLFVFFPRTGRPWEMIYPNIPNIRTYEPFTACADICEHDKKILREIVDAVIRESEG